MSESRSLWRCGCVSLSPVKIIIESTKIIASNKVAFTSIMLLTIIPLSTLVISESIYTHSLASQIQHLEALARLASTRFEARHVWHESRHDAFTLLRIRAFFALPSYLLSLAAALSAVHSTLLALRRPPAASTTTSSLRSAAIRLLATTLFVYSILFAFSPLPRALAAASPSAAARLFLLAVSSALEVYLMAFTSLSIVVSVAEEKFGWEAIRVGFYLVKENRVCGWVLSGLLVVGSSMIRCRVKRLMEGQDLIAVEDKASVIVLYGLLVLWSYVVMSVFYFDCRKRHPIKEPQPDDCQHSQHQLSVTVT